MIGSPNYVLSKTVRALFWAQRRRRRTPAAVIVGPWALDTVLTKTTTENYELRALPHADRNIAGCFRGVQTLTLEYWATWHVLTDIYPSRQELEVLGETFPTPCIR